ncbi:MAG: hypothetical protein HQK52_19610 [Oligoflexia bacterium]|nr:hypothetical protein [Oligoflexia bacterium]
MKKILIISTTICFSLLLLSSCNKDERQTDTQSISSQSSVIENERTTSNHDSSDNQNNPTPTVIEDASGTIQSLVQTCPENQFWNEQISQCQRYYPLRFSNKSILNIIKNKNLRTLQFCLDISRSTEHSNDLFLKWEQYIKSAILEWLNPIQKNKEIALIKEIIVVNAQMENCDMDTSIAKINILPIYYFSNIPSDTDDIAVAFPNELPMPSISIYEKSPCKTLIHEFGHLFGFDDHYIRSEYKKCQDGYGQDLTVMCRPEENLGTLDKDGMSRLFCQFWPESENCRSGVNSTYDLINGLILTCYKPDDGIFFEFSNSITSFWLTTGEYPKEGGYATTSHNFYNLIPNEPLDSEGWHFHTSDNNNIVNIEIDYKKNKILVSSSGDENFSYFFKISNDLSLDGKVQYGDCNFIDKHLEYVVKNH